MSRKNAAWDTLGARRWRTGSNLSGWRPIRCTHSALCSGGYRFVLAHSSLLSDAGLTAGLLGSQRSQGVPKMKRQTGRTVEVNFKGAHSHEKETKQVRTPALAPILSAVC